MATPKKLKLFNFSNLGMSAADEVNLEAIANRLSSSAWNHTEVAISLSPEERTLIKEFKEKLKHYLFYVGQKRLCCFCGIELNAHKATYDLEHIISKNNKKNLIFNLRNLALSCKPCNQSKSDQKVTLASINEDDDIIFAGVNDYILVHPHLNEWDSHLLVDRFNRIVAIDDKGRQTIIICGINKLNAMRLSDHFAIFTTQNEYDDWVYFYSKLANEDSSVKKTKYKRILKKILNLASDPAGKELLEVLSPLLD